MGRRKKEARKKASLFEKHLVGDRRDRIANQRLRLSAERQIRRNVVARRDERECTSLPLPLHLTPLPTRGPSHCRAPPLRKTGSDSCSSVRSPPSRALRSPSPHSDVFVPRYLALVCEECVRARCNGDEHSIWLHGGPSGALRSFQRYSLGRRLRHCGIWEHFSPSLKSHREASVPPRVERIVLGLQGLGWNPRKKRAVDCLDW